MIKYLLLSLIGYYIFVNYLSTMIEGKRNETTSDNQQQKQNNHEDEYVDYEEVD